MYQKWGQQIPLLYFFKLLTRLMDVKFSWLSSSCELAEEEGVVQFEGKCHLRNKCPVLYKLFNFTGCIVLLRHNHFWISNELRAKGDDYSSCLLCLWHLFLYKLLFTRVKCQRMFSSSPSSSVVILYLRTGRLTGDSRNGMNIPTNTLFNLLQKKTSLAFSPSKRALLQDGCVS